MAFESSANHRWRAGPARIAAPSRRRRRRSGRELQPLAAAEGSKDVHNRKERSRQPAESVHCAATTMILRHGACCQQTEEQNLKEDSAMPKLAGDERRGDHACLPVQRHNCERVGKFPVQPALGSFGRFFAAGVGVDVGCASSAALAARLALVASIAFPAAGFCPAAIARIGYWIREQSRRNPKPPASRPAGATGNRLPCVNRLAVALLSRAAATIKSWLGNGGKSVSRGCFFIVSSRTESCTISGSPEGYTHWSAARRFDRMSISRGNCREHFDDWSGARAVRSSGAARKPLPPAMRPAACGTDDGIPVAENGHRRRTRGDHHPHPWIDVAHNGRRWRDIVICRSGSAAVIDHFDARV